jgi:ABC-type lipoprotein export system ATPase subunit
MFKENLTNEELNIARQNGFILTGKTGTGKSTLLNVIFSQEVLS